MTLGPILKEEGRKRVAARNEEWLARIREDARDSSQYIDGTVTTDAHAQLCRRYRLQPTHHNAWGTIFACKGWKRIGYVQSKRPEAHARPIGVWTWQGDNHD